MAFEDDADDDVGRPPPPPDDRTWVHPSELGRLRAARAPRGGGRLIGTVVLAAVTGALATLVAVRATGGFERTVTVYAPVERVAVPVQDRVAAGPVDVVEIARTATPAIARLEVRAADGRRGGSGVVFRSDGYLYTNAHVVDGARSIRVLLPTAGEHTAEVVGVDPHTDIAVLRLRLSEPGTLPSAVLGTAEDLAVGEEAIAIGSPLGLSGGPTVTRGVISALDRTVRTVGGTVLYGMIQTDAPIAPGSSGGALLDGTGVVVGITTAVIAEPVGSEGLGFATPIDVVREVGEEIIAGGRAAHAWLGVEGTDLDSQVARIRGIAGGAVVDRVVDGSPADGAGLTHGDVIVAVDGRPLVSFDDLVVALRAYEPGDRARLTVWKMGGLTDIVVTLAERPSDS